MTILIINWQDWHNPYAGGAEIYLYEVFSRLTKKRHRVLLLCSRGKNQTRFEMLDGFEVYRIAGRWNFNYLAPFALRSILRHHKVDLIIDDLNKIPFFSRLFTKKAVLPMVMHLFRKAIYRETNPLIASYVYIMERLIPFLYPNQDVVAISHSTALELKKMGIKRNLHVVPCGIPEIPKDLRESRQKNLVCYVGRLKRYKSIDHFIEAVKAVSQSRSIEAMVVGDGDARPYLMRLANSLNVKATFTGYVSEEEKYRIYSRARVVVQPSIKEGWGLTAIEAQACATPVVCADSPGLREILVHNRTGYLYQYGNISELAKNLIRLLDDDALWHSFSKAAKEWANGFSWDSSAAKMEEILLHTLGHCSA